MRPRRVPGVENRVLAFRDWCGDTARKMQKILTDTVVRSIKPPARGRVEIADTRCSGLTFRVTPGGVRSWCFRFRDPGTKRSARMTLGLYPDLTLANARQMTDDARRTVAQGGNPLHLRREAIRNANTNTFEHLTKRFMAEYSERFKKSHAQDRRVLDKHVLPRWRRRPYISIRRRDVIELLEDLLKSGRPSLVNRVHSLVSTIYTFAIDSDLTEVNPCYRLRKRGKETVGSRILADDEIRALWPAVLLSPVSRIVGLALRLQLLTATRSGEVAGLHIRELMNMNDADKAAWILPAERSKNGKEHLIPLSRTAQAIIAEAQELTGGKEYIFPSAAVEDAPVTSHAISTALYRLIRSDKLAVRSLKKSPPSPHDFRRTVATRLAALGIIKEDRDAVLNHTPQDVGSKHYNKYDRQKEKREALNKWETELLGLVAGAR